MTKKKICFIATLELSVKVFLTGHLRRLQEIYDTSVIVSTDNSEFLKSYGISTQVIPVEIERNISLVRDLRSLFSVYSVLRRERFAIIHSIMPKSGLLSMVAGLFARVPVRVHTFTGQLWKNDTGLKRMIFKYIDKVIAACATNILVDSPSQREFIISEGVVSKKKSSVIGQGSICGVDMERFSLDEKARQEIRREYGFGGDDVVFFFLGRMKRDKGILDLARAFSLLCNSHSNARLLIVGPDEEDMIDGIREICAKHSGKVHILGFTDTPERYLSAVDVLCLPSYREGFGQVIAEAAAVGIPSIGSRIYGITDAIDDGVTGFLFEPSAHHEMMQKMKRFIEDPSLPKTMGQKARLNVAEKYTKEKVTAAMLAYYKKLEKSL